jgi:hypothetical protein
MAYQVMKGGLVGEGPGRQISRKIQIRLMWPLTVLLLLNSLDRVNISFGALQMNQEIGLKAADYGLASASSSWAISFCRSRACGP